MIEYDKIPQFSPFCLSCLGRCVGRVGFGIDNRERGIELLNLFDLNTDILNGDNLICEPEDCSICEGLMSEVDDFIDIVVKEISDYSINSFKIGSIIDVDIKDRESSFHSIFDCDSEYLKSQLNREIGRGVHDKSKLDVVMDYPDAVAIIDTRYNTVQLEIKSLFIEGNYNKFDRTIPQTRWPCSKCKGLGCRDCGNTGQLYSDSVQSLISMKFIEISGAEEDLFHGMGREDIDAAMLGNGRPFVLELRRPKLRNLNLEHLSEQINQKFGKRIKVHGLKHVKRHRVAELKNTVCEKSYRVDVSIQNGISIESLKKGAQKLTGAVVEQRTPTRVSHRRADLIRSRLINYVDVKSYSEGFAELEIRAQHGTYIRELVSGDDGRTEPSLSSLVASACKVEVLDVLDLHLKSIEEKNV